MDDIYEKIIAELEDEWFLEVDLAKRVERNLKRTLNPFRRAVQKRLIKTSMDHAIGIGFAIHRVRKIKERS